MTLVIVHEDLVNKMWFKYMKNVDDYDKRLTDGWKGDANGVLVFVSLHLLVPVSITVTIWEPDRSFLRNCRIFHHRKLQKLIARSWQPVCVSPRTIIPAVCWFRKWHPRPTAIVPFIPSQRLHYMRKHIVATELCA
jgi:hypothetical protein